MGKTLSELLSFADSCSVGRSPSAASRRQQQQPLDMELRLLHGVKSPPALVKAAAALQPSNSRRQPTAEDRALLTSLNAQELFQEVIERDHTYAALLKEIKAAY